MSTYTEAGDGAYRCVASTGDTHYQVLDTIEDDGSSTSQTAAPSSRGNSSESSSSSASNDSDNEDVSEDDSSTGTTISSNSYQVSGLPQFFRSIQIAADGRTIVAHSGDHCLRTYSIPETITTSKEDSTPPSYHTLWTKSTIPSASAIRTFVLYPYFNSNNPATSVFLWSVKDQPTHLRNAMQDHVHGGFKLIDTMTEEYVIPSSLAWTPDGCGFVAGCKDQIAVFDAHRPWEDPVRIMRAPRKNFNLKHHDVWPGTHGTGIFGALAMSPDGVLAAGNTEGCIVLFNEWGRGDFVASLSLREMDRSGEISLKRGNGVMQMEYSSDGKYLLVAERRSDCVQVFDIRDLSQRLAYLTGRNADTPQRMGFGTRVVDDKFEVCAGGADGVVRIWKHVTSLQGDQTPNESFKAHDDVVTSATWRSGGDVLATSSGRYTQGSHGSRENSLKLWVNH